MESTIYKKLIMVQKDLKAPKSQRNNFGNYNYRNQEDILEVVKPLLAMSGLTLRISDKLVEISGRFYVEATATLVDVETKEEVSTVAYAREEETKKGMDASQITGSASSYARKYALNGLFLIDDTKDADTYENKPEVKKETTPVNKVVSQDKTMESVMVAKCTSCNASISTNVATYSKREFGKLLCRNCQEKQK